MLQAGVIMQLYAKLGTMSTHSSPDKKSEIHSDMALDIWSLSEIRAKVHQFLAKIKLFFFELSKYFVRVQKHFNFYILNASNVNNLISMTLIFDQ